MKMCLAASIREINNHDHRSNSSTRQAREKKKNRLISRPLPSFFFLLLSFVLQLSHSLSLRPSDRRQFNVEFQMQEIDATRLRRLPPPPLFTLRPPPKPPVPLFDHFQSGAIFNGQCQRPTFARISPPPLTNDSTFTWLNLFLLLMAILSVICCFIIVIFIYICLK